MQTPSPSPLSAQPVTVSSDNAMRRRLSLVIGGHVDHGKSTIIGRLLVDTGSLPEGKLEAVRASCERTSKPFEYAFLLDALKDEQAQGITIDAARVFFRTAQRPYVIIDAPGHIEFIRNLVTGASRAEAALLVIDAKEGLQENSRRHGYMMSMLGIRQVVVLVNKMDLVDYHRATFDRIAAEYRDFLAHLDMKPEGFIPVSGREGDNIAHPSRTMTWYEGPTVLQALDRFRAEGPRADLPFRMPVQDVYKFTREGDDRRIVAGTIDTGRVHVGDELVFYPSGKRSAVRTIEAFNRARPEQAEAGEATGFTLSEQIYLARGELASIAGQPRPEVTTRLRTSLFWLGRQPLVKHKEYVLKLGTARVPVEVEEIHRVVNAATLEAVASQARVDRHEVAECTLKTSRALALDPTDRLPITSRFALVDDFEIRGGGVVLEALDDTMSGVRDRVLLRNYKWEPSHIAPDLRSERYRQRPTLVLMTGERADERKRLAKDLERRLFEQGHVAYFLGIGNVLYGVDADIARDPGHRREHLRRLAEVANLMLDAGIILIVTAAELTQTDVELIETTVDPDRIELVWVGGSKSTDVEHDLQIHDAGAGDAVDQIERLLRDRGILVPSGPVAGTASVIWFTGLSGSGKSTIASRVTDALRREGLRVEHLDGDSVRAAFPRTGFTRPERDEHLRRVGFLASRMETQGVFVVASFVSPYQESRDAVRAMCRSFIEVHVSTPLEECERRDTKGLYRKARRGEIAHFTGISDPYEPPARPELVIDTTQVSVDEAVDRVMAMVRNRMGGNAS